MSEEQNTKKNFSVKQFFKSTAFKCIAVLVVIVLVCGVLLTICNALFKVTDEEKLDRVLGSIYPDGQVEEIVYNESHPTELETSYSNGKITAVYLMDDGNYLINASGTGGYKGNVYCWVVVEMDGTTAIEGIGKVAIDRSDGETYLDFIPDAAFDFYSKNYADGENFNVQDIKDDQLTGGATLSMTAITNAVNTALSFVRTQILDEEEPEPEPVNPFAEFEYNKYIDGQQTTVELAENGTDVIFHVTTPKIVTGASKIDITVNNEGTILDFKVTTEGTTANGPWLEDALDDILDGTRFKNKKAADLIPLLGTAPNSDPFNKDLTDEELQTGATLTNFYYVYAAVFAASNYDKGYEMALENAVVYSRFVNMDETTAETSGKNVIFHVTTPQIVTGASKIDITVDNEGIIVDFKVTAEGTTANGPWLEDALDDILDGTRFKNKKAADLIPLLGTAPDSDPFNKDLTDEELQTGATLTNFYYVYAAVFAASNYETFPALMEYKQQQLNAQMSEIYGEEITVEAVSLDGLTTTIGDSTINTVYSIVGTSNYIVNVTATSDFPTENGGSVTCWVVIETANAAVSGIGNVVIASNENQSFISHITDEALDHFSESFNGSDFTIADWDNNSLTSGATYTTTAIIETVNVAKNFVAANLLTGGTVA